MTDPTNPSTPVGDTGMPVEVVRSVRIAREYRVSADHSDQPQRNHTMHDAIRWLASDCERLQADNAAQAKEIAELENRLGATEEGWSFARSRLEIAERERDEAWDSCIAVAADVADARMRGARDGVDAACEVLEKLRASRPTSTSTDREVGK